MSVNKWREVMGDYSCTIIPIIILIVISPVFFESVQDYCGGLFVDGCQPLENTRIAYMFLTIIIFVATIYPCLQLGENKRMLRKILEKLE